MTHRSKFIGGSDVASILGLNRYKTPYEIWDEKKNGNNPFTGNQFTEWGTKFEPVIISHFEQKNSQKVTDNNKLYCSHIEHLACHPDGLFLKNGEYWLLEVKTASTNSVKHWGNEIPLEYYCQLQHNMFCTGTKKAMFVYLVLDSREYNEIEVYFDETFVNKQNEYLVSWWNRYIIGNEIPLKLVEDFERENPEQKQIEATEEIVELCRKTVEIRAKIKELTTEKDEIENKIKMQIGDATDLTYGLETLSTWRPQTRVTVDTKKLKAEQPDIFLKYAKESTSRTFLLKS